MRIGYCDDCVDSPLDEYKIVRRFTAQALCGFELSENQSVERDREFARFYVVCRSGVESDESSQSAATVLYCTDCLYDTV